RAESGLARLVARRFAKVPGLERSGNHGDDQSPGCGTERQAGHSHAAAAVFPEWPDEGAGCEGDDGHSRKRTGACADRTRDTGTGNVMSAQPFFTLEVLRRWKEIAPTLDPPARVAVIGDPIAHSRSPQMH